MKIEAFVTLETVLRTGTLAAAAKALHLTPSAVSLQMKQLEAYIGQQLFDRSGLEIKPLPTAYEVSETMQRALDRLETFRRRKTVVVEGNLQLGIIESMQPLLLPGMTRILRARYPALHVQSRRGKSAELTTAVKAGLLDAAVVGQPETGGSSRLHWHPLQDMELALVAPPGERETSPAALFRRYEWIRYDRKTIAGRLAARYVNRHIRQRHGTIELDSVRAILSMVSAGLGVSIVQLSEPGVCLSYPVSVLRLRDAPVIRFSVVMRKADADSRPLTALKQVLEQALASAGGPATKPVR